MTLNVSCSEMAVCGPLRLVCVDITASTYMRWLCVVHCACVVSCSEMAVCGPLHLVCVDITASTYMRWLCVVHCTWCV